MSLFLVGYMGSGKSSVGKRIANRLGLEFVDMDTEIEEYANARVEDIFRESGEEVFRMLESRVLDKLLDEGPYVIATGGGAPCHSGNMDKIMANGIAIYLKLPPSKIYKRITQSLIKTPTKRPLVAGLEGQELMDFIQTHMEERGPVYERAHRKINADRVNATALQTMQELYEKWTELIEVK